MKIIMNKKEKNFLFNFFLATIVSVFFGLFAGGFTDSKFGVSVEVFIYLFSITVFMKLYKQIDELRSKWYYENILSARTRWVPR